MFLPISSYQNTITSTAIRYSVASITPLPTSRPPPRDVASLRRFTYYTLFWTKQFLQNRYIYITKYVFYVQIQQAILCWQYLILIFLVSYNLIIIIKYYIPERVIVKNVTLMNMKINRGAAWGICAEIDIYIPQGDIFHYHPLRNVIFILLYRTSLLLLASGEIGPTYASLQDSDTMTFQIIG